jgi:hypothetical protein
MRAFGLLMGLVMWMGAASAAPKAAVLELRHPKSMEAETVSYLTDRVRQVAQRRAKGAWEMLTRQNLAALLPPGQDLADCEGECEVETGRNIGADYVISGRILPFDKGLRALLTLHDTRSGRQISSTHAGGSDLKTIEANLVRATQQLVDAVPEVRGLQAPAPTALSRLQVNAPVGTRITVEGKSMGVAPRIITVPAGGRRIELEHPCGGRWSGTLAIFPGQSTPLNVDFDRECAGVDMHSTPMGAELFVDGQRMGLTPMRVYLKKGKSHRIEARKTGLLPSKTSLYLNRTRTDPWTLHLLPPKKTARIVATRPDGSECKGRLWIDGKDKGLTPWQGLLSQGRYAVETECGPRHGRQKVAWPQTSETVRVRTEDHYGELRLDLFGPEHFQIGLGGWFMERKTGRLRVGMEGHGGRYRLNHADTGYDKAVNHFGGALRFAIPMSDHFDWTLAGAVDISWTNCKENAGPNSDCALKDAGGTFDVYPTLSARTGIRYLFGHLTVNTGVWVHRPFMYRIPEYSVIPYVGSSLLF